MRDADDLRRRVKAARALAGFTVGDLAKALPADAKLGARTLRTLEGDSAPRSFRRHELDLIARAAGISTAFFDVDFATLEDADAAGTTETLEDQLARHESLIRQLVAVALPTAEDELGPTPGPAHELPADNADTEHRDQTRRRRGA